MVYHTPRAGPWPVGALYLQAAGQLGLPLASFTWMERLAGLGSMDMMSQ
jgi:hypothetical protein